MHRLTLIVLACMVVSVRCMGSQCALPEPCDSCPSLFPAINLAASGTRKEHLLMSEQELKTVTALRRRLMNMKPPQQIEQLLAALKRFETNEQLVRG